jgi:hypothetical protein
VTTVRAANKSIGDGEYKFSALAPLRLFRLGSIVNLVFVFSVGVDMLKSEFVPGGIGDGEPPKRSPPDDQTFAYVEAKGAARKPVGALLDIIEPNGKPDRIVYACLMRAHDIALLLGHQELNCIHLVTALVADPEGRKKLTGILAGLQPPVPLNPEGVLRACTSHISCEQKPITVTDREFVEAGDPLKEWFGSAKEFIKERSVEAQFIEVKHLVAAAKMSSVSEIADAWHLLNAEPALTLEQRISAVRTDISDTKTQVKPWVDAAMAAVTGGIGQVALRIADHERESEERMKRLEWILSSMHGAVDKVGDRVDEHEQRSTASMERLEHTLSSMHGGIDANEKKIDAVGGLVAAHHQETLAGFSLIDGGGTALRKLHTTTEKVAHIYRDRIGLAWSSISLLAATLVGGAAGFLLQP